MKIWIDAQLSPFIALWINNNFPELTAASVRSLGKISASDKEIFMEARLQGAVILSKDIDFLRLVELYGSPPQIIWVTCGNTSNAAMCQILQKTLAQAIDLLKNGEPVVEINN